MSMQAITLRQLRSVQAVNRLGTIAAAARVLGLTAPAITLQIKQMEEEFGLPLNLMLAVPATLVVGDAEQVIAFYKRANRADLPIGETAFGALHEAPAPGIRR